MSCVYLGEQRNESRNGAKLFGCQINEECVLKDGDRKVARCDKCSEHLELSSPEFVKKWQDPVEIYTRTLKPTKALHNLLADGTAFLVAGGPSADPFLERLNSRGCFSLAVNNAAAYKVRPQAFVCSDPPMKFHQDIWLDPGVMKFVPSAKLTGRRRRMRTKVDGVFDRYDPGIDQAPNVWGYKRWSWLWPDDRFFLTNGCCWGNQDDGVRKTGEEKTVCTMMLGLRLLRYLGARRIYLVGVDFFMQPNYGYSFNQARDAGASASNNDHFRIVNDWLCKMQQDGVFKQFGLEIFNCCERSGLRAFPFMPFEDALRDAKGIIGERERVEQGEPDCEGWYEKVECPKCGSWHLRYSATACECLNKKCGLKWNPQNPPPKPEKNK